MPSGGTPRCRSGSPSGTQERPDRPMSAASRVAAGRDERPELVVIGPPTANGDLHVGHVAGPCVGADVRVRYLRAAGRPVVFASGVDDSQTFVVTAAPRPRP